MARIYSFHVILAQFWDKLLEYVQLEWLNVIATMAVSNGYAL